MKTLVLYFSATQTTKRVAEQVARHFNADIYALHARRPYTAADLNWHDPQSRTSIEQHEHASRVAVQRDLPDLTAYDQVIIGHPIWWGIPPRLIADTIDHLDLTGKRFTSFATSGGSGYGRAQWFIDRSLKENGYAVDRQPGAVINGKRDLKTWLQGLNFE